MSFNQLFKNAVSGITASARFMDEKKAPFIDSILDLVKTMDNLSLDSADDQQAFKEKVEKRFNIFFEGNNLRVSKPKLEANKRGMCGYTIFVEEHKTEFRKIHNIEANKEGFARLGKIFGEEWKKLSDEEKQVYNDKAAEKNIENKTVKKSAPKPAAPTKEVHPCEYDGCERTVKTDALDGAYYCYEHKKKMISAGKPKTTKTVKADKPKKAQADKPKKAKADKPESKARQIVEIEEDEPAPAEENFDISYFESEEPVSIDDTDYWSDSNIKKIKGTEFYFHKESKVAFENDDDGDKVFVGFINEKELVEHLKSKIPDEVIDWVRECGLIVPVRK